MLVTPTRRLSKPCSTKWFASDAEFTSRIDRFSTVMRWSFDSVSRISGVRELRPIAWQDIQLLAVGGVQQIANPLVVDLHKRHEARVVNVVLRLAASDFFKEIC